MTDISQVKQIVSGRLTAAGFLPLGEYSAADSLLHKDEDIGFFGIREYRTEDEAMSHDGSKLFTEISCLVEIRLMGKAGGFSDYDEFIGLCDGFFFALAKEDGMIVNSAKLGGTVQSLPLRRLERTIELRVRICFEEECGNE